MKVFEFRFAFHWSLFLDPIVNMSALVQEIAWRRIGDKSLPEPIMTQIDDAYMRVTAPMSY